MDYTKQEQIVLDFIGAYRDSWPADMAAALKPLAEDAYYQIVVPTIPPVHGRDKILAESRARMLRASARDAAMKQLQMQRDAASSAGSRLLIMPLVLGAAAIVPIVMASRLMTKGDAEGFDGEEQITRQHVVKALAKALAISTVGIALVAWSISRGGFVAAWVCSIAVLLIAI